jgi:hypothetical protein
MKLQANAIADQTDIDDRAKMRLLEKLYRGGKGKKEKRERQYAVAKKNGKNVRVGSGKGPTVRVDARMKKEKRAKKAQTKRAKKHSRSTNKKKVKRN